MRSIVFGSVAAFVLFITAAHATTFVSAISFAAGTTAHVTVYDGAGNALDPAINPVTWKNLPAGITVAVDATGYVFTDPNVAPSVSLSAVQGIATGPLLVTVTAPLLKFSSP